MSDKYIRQAGIVPAERATRAVVIGCGAIGRQVALQLAAIGVKGIALYDHDTVEDTNCVTQGYKFADIGMYKVDATARDCRDINPDVTIHTYPRKFTKKILVDAPVFCCVDDMVARKYISVLANGFIPFFTDGRMTGETCRILSVGNEDDYEYYRSTLFDNDEAEVGRCTSRSTIFCANIAAAFMVSSYTMYLRGFPLDRDIVLNILAKEMQRYKEPIK